MGPEYGMEKKEPAVFGLNAPVWCCCGLGCALCMKALRPVVWLEVSRVYLTAVARLSCHWPLTQNACTHCVA